ncbi:MAG: DUF928 domain-containing protein [Candidatus Tectomicrobia bacterium]|uniref:DUF928 domain-containing protein n=1 Tax=Tectimicrobiota bacterium TaxID=2528274 RepID=A0A932CM47_UNCTE|nr:DUF928 domain-containing protein [Candidatus Tectomicrobia bacterium]
MFGYALVPEDQFGLTAQAQPSLCWYLLEPVGSPVVFVMGEDQAVQPLLDRPLSPPLKPGMHCVQLADHGVRLSPGKLYVWFVEVRIDSENRSGDKVAGG